MRGKGKAEETMNVTHILFSPTGGTEKVARILTQGLGEWTRTVDLADPKADLAGVELSKEDVCLIAAPSFGGRAPATAMERLARLKGNGARAVVVAVYGGREFEDTLVELRDVASSAGFQVVGAVSALAEHSVVRKFAVGRPDGQDAQQLKEFGQTLRAALEQGRTAEPELPGSRPYKEYKGSPARPLADESCTGCGLCAQVCPVEAIPAENPSGMEVDKCISCMRCESVCPVKARKLDAGFQGMVEKMLTAACTTRKENQLYL